MPANLRYVGLDVHKESIVVAVAEGNHKVKAVTAVARELADFVWAITRVEKPLPNSDKVLWGLVLQSPWDLSLGANLDGD